MNEKKNIPKLRFPGFTDAWEQRKLGEIVQVVMGQSPESQNYTSNQKENILVQGNADIKDGHIVPRVWTTQITKMAEKGDLILTVRAPVGDIAITNYNVVLGRGVAGIKGNLFIYQFFNFIRDKNYWKIISTGSTFDSVTSNQIRNLEIGMPIEKEQTQLGEFFYGVDNLITFHQRKLENLKKQKKSLLQKMFPKNNEEIPELRFPNFTSAWKKCKLREIGNIYTGNTPSTMDKENWSETKNSFVWITPTDIKSLITIKSERYLTSKGWRKARVVPKNSVLITSIASIGKNTINGVSAAFNQQINAIVPHKSDPYFILSSMENESFRFSSLAGKSATSIINKTEFEKFSISTPTIQEQTQIGNFFQSVDNLITLHQRKLENLQKLKKGLLQQMFV